MAQAMIDRPLVASLATQTAVTTAAAPVATNGMQGPELVEAFSQWHWQSIWPEISGPNPMRFHEISVGTLNSQEFNY